MPRMSEETKKVALMEEIQKELEALLEDSNLSEEEKLNLINKASEELKERGLCKV